MAVIKIENVVVLGAGVMGAQIAALLAAAGRNVHLLDMPARDDPTGRAKLGLQQALASRPPAFFLPEMAERVTVGNFDDLQCIGEADWVIEAVLEEATAKRELLARIEPYFHDDLIISSNTSGLSIAELAQGRSSSFVRRFFGVHFFNPPRYMNLVELVSGPATEPGLLDAMAVFLTDELGKGVVRAKDTPNFIGNRMWIFAACDMLRRMENSALGVEAVDAITGPLMGRPKSGILRVCDIVGLDTVAHVAATSYAGLENDPWREDFLLPAFYKGMLQQQLLGAKVNAGFYRKGKAGIEALDFSNLAYRPLQKVDLGGLEEALREPSPQGRILALWQDRGQLGEQGRLHLLNVLAYAAEHAAEMADDIAQIDQAMRWGFNWDLGPFEIWDLIGVEEVARVLQQQRLAVPEVAVRLLAGKQPRFYGGVEGEQRIFSPLKLELEPWQAPIGDAEKLDPDRASWSNSAAYLVELTEDIGALVFSSKMNVLGPAVLEAVHHTVDTAPYEGIVLCGAGDLFSVGADLKHMAGLVAGEKWQALEDFVASFQQAVQALRFAPFPVVAAVRGLALGGGCEFSLVADARIAAAELSMGLVETKVGLIPGSGGCMEMARRGANDILAAFDTVFAGAISSSAFQARAWGMLEPRDQIVMGQGPLLLRAVDWLQDSLAKGYSPVGTSQLQITGSKGYELMGHSLDERLEANLISQHDAVVGRGLARVLSGGAGGACAIEEKAMLDLEREVFVELCATEMTRARIEYMLKTGKPLRN